MEFDEREEQKINLFVLLEDFLREARRLWVMGLALVVLCSAVLGIRANHSYSPIYQASASFTVKVADPVYASIQSYNTKTAEQMAKTFPYILTSGVLEKRIKETLGISYLPAVSVSVMPNSSMITLSVRDSDPQRAYDVLNAAITHYPEIAEFVVGATALALLDESGMPTAPINARTTKNAMMKGAILGLGVWCALVLLMALSKTTIHHEDMLRTYLSFECFGQIPQVKITAKDPCPLMTQIRRRPEFSEAIRSLRMRVERSMDQDDKKVLLISSAIPGEGKSTISINLAISMAQRGKRVLLIDCDLRNPSVAKGLKMRSDCSLTDYLLGRMTLKELLRPTDIDNLYIIPGGSGDPKAADLLNQERGLGMIHAARNLFDFVILDTPPCSMLADTGEVAALADAGLLVVRQDFASRGQILDGVQRMHADVVDGAAMFAGLEIPPGALFEHQRVLPGDGDGPDCSQVAILDLLAHHLQGTLPAQAEHAADFEMALPGELDDLVALRERRAQRLVPQHMAPCAKRLDDQSAASAIVVADADDVAGRLGQHRVNGRVGDLQLAGLRVCLAGLAVFLTNRHHLDVFHFLGLGQQLEYMLVTDSDNGEFIRHGGREGGISKGKIPLETGADGWSRRKKSAIGAE